MGHINQSEKEKAAQQWLLWAQEMQAMAQNGLTFSSDSFDIERYERLRAMAAEIIEKHSEYSWDSVHGLLLHETGYATPKVDVRGVCFQGDQILLVREVSDKKWTLPGGWGDVGQSPRENVEREVREESGYVVNAVKLLAVYDREKHDHYPKYLAHIYKLFFLCDIVGGSPQVNLEVDDISFFNLDALPELSVRRVTEKQIHRMAILRHAPQADFD